MIQQQQTRKRSSYPDSSGYDLNKRPAVHDIRGSGVRTATGAGGSMSDLYDIPSSVFSRLDPQKQAAAAELAHVSQLAGGMSGMLGGSGGKTGGASGGSDSYTRRSSGDTGAVGGGGGYRQGGYGSGGLGGRDQHIDNLTSYPVSSLGKNRQNSSPSYQKSSGNIGGGVSVVQKGSLSRQSQSGLSRQNQDIIQAALANIQKTVHQSPSSSVASQMRSSPIQQISPGGIPSAAGGLGDFVSLGNRGDPMGSLIPSIAGGGVTRQLMGGVTPIGKPVTKLPPEDERYNRRFTRPAHGGGRQPMKRFQ